MFVSTSSVAAALALLAARSALALPSAATSNVDASETGASSIKLVHSEIIEGGLVWAVYNDESLPVLDVSSADDSSAVQARSGPLDRRCGSNNVFCDFAAYRARTLVCGNLMDVLGDPARRVKIIDQNETSECLINLVVPNNHQCCISWSAQVPGLYTQYLFPAVEKMMPMCARDGLVSARATDVQLAGSCVTQCLSDRATGCA
jgi:hypothetical protein